MKISRFRISSLCLFILHFTFNIQSADVHFTKEQKEELLLKASKPESLERKYRYTYIKNDLAVYPFINPNSNETLHKIAQEHLEFEFETKCLNQIKSIKNPPSITIIAEDHTCPNCYLEKIKKLKDVKADKICFGLEGENCNSELIESDIKNDFFNGPLFNGEDKTQANLFGLEGLSKHFGNLLSIISLLNEKDPLQKVELDQIKEEVDTSVYSSLSYNLLMGSASLSVDILDNIPEIRESIKTKLPNEYGKIIIPIQNFFNEIKTIKKKESLNTKNITHALRIQFDSKYTNGELKTLFENIFRHIIFELIQSPEYKSSPSKSFIELFKKPSWTKEDIETIDDTFEVFIRNRSFVTNIIEKYCENISKNKIKPVYVQIGALHAPSVNYMLQKYFAASNVKINFENHFIKYFEMSPSDKLQHIKDSLEYLEKP